jgi:hypothetical protein
MASLILDGHPDTIDGLFTIPLLRATLNRLAEQSRRFAFEESPDITGQGGR